MLSVRSQFFASSKTFIDSFVLHCTMIRLFLSLTIISIVIVSIWFSNGYTVHNSLLTGHVFKTVESIDWLQCVEECHIHDECISYKYFPPEKVCELNNFGYNNHCDAGNNLIRTTGWIHHVLDISEVNYTCKYGLLSIFIARLGEKDSIMPYIRRNQQKKVQQKTIFFF